MLIFLLVFFIHASTRVRGSTRSCVITQIIVKTSEVVRATALFSPPDRHACLLAEDLVEIAERPSRLGGRAVETAAGGPAWSRSSRWRASCRMLGTLCKREFLSAHSTCASLHWNPVLNRRSIGIDRPCEGRQAARQEPCAESHLFPGAIVEMTRSRKKAANSTSSSCGFATVTEGDFDRQLKAVVAFAEPVMLSSSSAFIGTIFIGMVIPIFSSKTTSKTSSYHTSRKLLQFPSLRARASRPQECHSGAIRSPLPADLGGKAFTLVELLSCS